MSPPVRYLSEADVREVLDMPLALREVERAFAAHGRGDAVDTPRVRTRQSGAHLHVLQAAAPELNLIGFKAYYVVPGGSSTSLIQLIDRERGDLVALVESDWLGRVRTGASTGVAAAHLAREDARTLGLFGYGRQAVAQLEAVRAVRPLQTAKVYGRNAQAVRAFCEAMSARLGLQVRPAVSPEDTVRGSDIVITITRASQPLFDGRWLEPGQFVAAAGSNSLDRREIDLETVRRASLVVVDARETAERESGDLLPAVEAGLVRWQRLTELGEIVAGTRPGRSDASQIALFESHGMGLQDIYTAAQVLHLARERGLGTLLPMMAQPASGRTGALD
jgi:ornithine cyclodeaminase